MKNMEEMAAQVAAHPDYRLLRRYVQPQEYAPDDGSEKGVGLIIDVETTGLEPRRDRIIQLGMVKFSYCRETGRIYHILDVFAHFEDPGVRLPAAIVRITGITDDMVRGQSIDDADVKAFADAAILVIAHNAAFDRKFMERRFPKLTRKPWACSMYDVPWHEEDVASRSLGYLAYHYGFFFDAHRADNDCLASLHVLSKQLPISGRPVFQVLLENARRETHRIWAIDAPFDKKDLLKARNYRWNPGDDGRPKSWYKEVEEATALDEELRYLTGVIKCRRDKVRIDTVTALTRYSERE